MKSTIENDDSEEFKLQIINTSNPYWICPNGLIIIERDNKNYQIASEFIKKISKVKCLLEHMEEYIITEYTIYSAISSGIKPEIIIYQLKKYSKNNIPERIEQLIEKTIKSRIITVICNYEGRRICEGDKKIIEEIKECITINKNEYELKSNIIVFKKKCQEKGILINEKIEIGEKTIPIALKDDTVLRKYQISGISSVFRKGFAQSGIIILPCGAGKTLMTIGIICTFQQPTIIICTTTISIEQWRDEIRKWSTIPLNKIKCFSSIIKETIEESYIVITTYQMIQSKEIEEIRKKKYGMMILDEVHSSVAKEFRKIYYLIEARCRIGITATPIREDCKIKDLDYLIGPILYQESWKELIKEKYIANVQCIDIKCPMTIPFYEEYINNSNYRHKIILSALNPNKIEVTKFLIKQHLKRNEQIILFCDSIIVLKEIGYQINCPIFFGESPNKERLDILNKFKLKDINCIGMSSVGDTSLDIPDASVIIQISTNNGSRKQQLQRLGRISRIKKNERIGYFYTLTSIDTHEEYFIHKKQIYMQNLGFGFECINSTIITHMNTNEQLNLIKYILNESDKRYFNSKSKKESIIDF
ncbi:DNA repair helicase, putative [Entamoeba histolytica HM-1:IMSS-B]|uniref:DNA 3'-5' helicase n=6 Tax=Entamoeba histolytica TaxID=5759 RepID=C4M2T5_ENTH1|nr:DNA repair helicase, putative [Entamoeba histolytica HM-1:IMSS]EMD43753.1 rad25/xpB DNA repair helicase, putative [Entamoeba histolytica KU27]EMH73735.1 DNA repair helicase, putative [Entamoeba histolytica HM-1:IMSS-B]EMS12263.1 rad25/xp-B DNA repair helicase, putative [Entamoeba histolytica HM-3:IMSS]ENY61748.1 rad25/xp-B DNA repair helicase, putative [Entamoeba histolytica HM-1:IMSS-A]GAT95605.1 DNA repair helicase putative [Entamoeba histolytica]|eukprot:XP_654948.1 DNA repair helicase, putative [Entamoeba histolytica HM-1:IMSS]